MNLDKIDIILVRRAVENPGTHQKEIYRPLLDPDHFVEANEMIAPL